MLFSALAAGGAAAAGTAAASATAVGAAGSAIGTAGTLLSAVGTGVGMVGQFMQSSAGKKAEKLRERQMNLESAREKRQIVRQAILARSEALASATAQGAQYGSGLQGGQAQITNNAAQGILGVNQNTEIGAGIFKANRDMATAGMVSSIGSGMQGLGSNLVNNMDLYGRLGAYYKGNA